MRTLALVLTAMLAAALSLPVAADEANDPSVPPAAEAEPSAADAPSRDLVPCGCGGPKAIYAARYGTVQPPIMQELANGSAAEDAAIASPDQPAAATDAGTDSATDGGS